MSELTEEPDATMYATADDLFVVDLPEEDYILPSGKAMRIRALTRAEMMRSYKLEGDRPKQEQYLLSVAVLQPRLTEADVARFQKAKAFMVVEHVARAINRLSGVESKDAAKSDLPEDGE
jgi:hypothetical protein